MSEFDAIVEELASLPPNGQASLLPALNALDLDAFLALKLPPRAMLLDPILPGKGLVMLHAPRGTGKTYLATAIAYAVASGGALLSWRASEPRRVVYLDGEMPAAVMQRRLAAIVAGAKAEPPDASFFRILAADLCENGLPDLASPEGQDAVEAVLNGAELLVLDNLSCLVRSGRENEADSWQPVQEWLLKLRRRGVAVLLVHHSGKGGQQRGTSKREDVLDTVLSLRRPQDYSVSEGARFEVHVEKARGVTGDALAPFEALLETRDDAALWTMKTLADVNLARVAALTNEGLSVRDIAGELGLGLATISRLQRVGREAGIITVKASRGGKGGRKVQGLDD